MTPFFAAVDPAFKLLAPRSADWLTILPELAIAGLSLLCLLQAMLLPKSLRSLIPVTARTGLVLVALMSLVTGPWTQAADVESFAGLLRQNLPTDGVRLVFLLSALLTSFLAERFLRDEGIRVVGGSLRGAGGRRLHYWPVSGRALQRGVTDAVVPVARPVPAPQPVAAGGELELF